MSALVQSITAWVSAHSTLVWGVTIASALTFVGTLIAVPALLAWMPADYFVVPPRQSHDGWITRHPMFQLAVKVFKNIAGGLFVLAGMAMLVLPGQGLLTMLVGVALLDLPGKRTLEIALLRRPHVLRGVNWLRRRANRPPLRLPPG